MQCDIADCKNDKLIQYTPPYTKQIITEPLLLFATFPNEWDFTLAECHSDKILINYSIIKMDNFILK